MEDDQIQAKNKDYEQNPALNKNGDYPNFPKYA